MFLQLKEAKKKKSAKTCDSPELVLFEEGIIFRFECVPLKSGFRVAVCTIWGCQARLGFFFLFCIFFLINWILSSPFSLLICADRRLLSSTAGTACKELLVRLTRMEGEREKKSRPRPSEVISGEDVICLFIFSKNPSVSKLQWLAESFRFLGEKIRAETTKA